MKIGKTRAQHVCRPNVSAKGSKAQERRRQGQNAELEGRTETFAVEKNRGQGGMTKQHRRSNRIKNLEPGSKEEEKSKDNRKRRSGVQEVYPTQNQTPKNKVAQQGKGKKGEEKGEKVKGKGWNEM